MSLPASIENICESCVMKLRNKANQSSDNPLGRRVGMIVVFGATILMIALFMVACQPDTRATYIPVEVTPVALYSPEYHYYDEVASANIYYSITIVNQGLINNYLHVDDVESGEVGWLVIYAYDQRRTGAVVGYAPLVEGENDDFFVEIDPDLSTPILFAIIHTDNGARNVFDYPDFDPPVVFEGKMIGIPIQIMDPVGESTNVP